MKLQNQNIMFFTRTMGLGGTEKVVLQLCEIFKTKVNNIVVCSCGGVNVKKLNEMGIKHYNIPDITIKKPLDIIKVLFMLKKIIIKERITIIHSHHRMAAFYTRIVATNNIVQIVNAHNTFYDKKKLTQMAYKKANIIAVGEQVKKNLVEYFEIPDNNIKVIYNAIEPFKETIKPDELLLKSKQKGYTLVGNIGRLSEQKGMEYFIKAAHIVYKKEKNIRFFIVGDGEDNGKLKKLSKDLLPEGVLVFMGYRSDIQNIMSQMDFIVLSSLWEGLPLTPIEAFSVGKTVIATKVDGTSEIVKDGYNGILVDKKDSNAIAKYIQILSNNNNLKEKLENGALQTYKKSFNINTLTLEYITYYKLITK